MLSPSLSRITNRMGSSITELFFHGIPPAPLTGKSVTHVSGTFCDLCLEPHRRAQGLLSFHGNEARVKGSMLETASTRGVILRPVLLLQKTGTKKRYFKGRTRGHQDNADQALLI